MKKNLRLNIIFCLVIALIFQLCIISFNNVTTADSSSNAKWTLMMYFDGDNKLDAVMETQLELIRQIDYNANIQIIVLIDGNNEGDTMLYHIVENSLIELEWATESDMDNPATLQQFIQTVKNDYTSDYYGLFIASNKGSAWQGICYDEHGDGTMITMPELNQILQIVTNNGDSKLDIISIETCMGGNTAVAYEIKEYCNYYIAGPECGLVSPLQGIGFPYQQSISELVSNSDMNPEEFSISCVNNFKPVYDPSTSIKSNLVAVNLSYMNEIGYSYNDLAIFLKDNINIYKINIKEALNQTKIFGEMWGINYIIEPYHFLEQLIINNYEYQNIKNQIQSYIDSSILAKKIYPGDTVYGLNLYLPRNTPDYNHALRYDSGILPSPYEETKFAQDTQWNEFLKTFLGIAYNTAPEIPIITGPQEGKTNEISDYNIYAVDPDGDNISFFIDWGDNTNSGWIGPYPSGETHKESHTWNEQGTFTIRVKVKDIHEAESDWVSLSVSMPKTKYKENNKIFTFLFGKISDIEENQQGGIRFLPLRLLKIIIASEEGFSIQIIDATYGGYPCCTYIYPEDFRGILGSSFICGFWIT